jgi:plasmid stabilization system protein ParE
MMEVVILSGADADLDDIYDRLGVSGAGDRFLHAVDRRLELLRQFPRLVPASLVTKVRKVKIGRTPFGLFYPLEGQRLMVVAIQDLRQDPRTLARIIRARL